MSSAPPSSSSPVLALPPPSRRLPPPCWSHDETLALIAAYAHKWLSLGRGNLRAPHWHDVSSAVAPSCPASPKTPVQCRHKIEKLRKRYRSEKQRPLSSWPFFPHMDAMEAGSGSAPRFAIPRAARSRPGPEEMRRRMRDEGGGGVRDVAAAVGAFGEGFLRMEKMRMDVSRETERMRMEMELKRTEMVLDCQRRIVETMVHRFMG